VRDIMAITLSNNVPRGVRRLFAVARGALCYGYFFYPLYALASEQLYRVAEAAVAEKCKALDAPGTILRATFEKRVDWLAGQGLLSEFESEDWHSIRKYRTAVSHPRSQRIIDPGSAVRSLRAITERINSLFG
jgi:hypothetical protein